MFLSAQWKKQLFWENSVSPGSQSYHKLFSIQYQHGALNWVSAFTGLCTRHRTRTSIFLFFLSMYLLTALDMHNASLDYLLNTYKHTFTARFKVLSDVHPVSVVPHLLRDPQTPGSLILLTRRLHHHGDSCKHNTHTHLLINQGRQKLYMIHHQI